MSLKLSLDDTRSVTCAGLTLPDSTVWKIQADYGISNGRFSLSGLAWERADNNRYRTEPDVAGQISDLIQHAFPWLHLMNLAHLRDAETGEPMFAVSNGWYWFTSPTKTDVSVPRGWEHLDGASRAAAYLDCDPRLFAGLTDESGAGDFADLVETLRPSWRQFADSVKQAYQL